MRGWWTRVCACACVCVCVCSCICVFLVDFVCVGYVIVVVASMVVRIQQFEEIVENCVYQNICMRGCIQV